MPSVNKPSLRDEFEVLKGRFGQLSKDEKIPEESHDLFEDLLTLLSVLMAAFLEKNTPKSSANSSRPPSQTPKDESALGHAGAHAKGQVHDPSRPANTRTVETVDVSPVRVCETCGEDLRRVPCRGHERRTQIDIVFEKVLRHVDAEIKACPHCGGETRGAFPEAFSGPVQYGAGIKAYILNLVTARMIPLRRVQQSLQNLIGLTIAEATILNVRPAALPGAGALGAPGHRADPHPPDDAPRRDLPPRREAQPLDPRKRRDKPASSRG